jgi:putative intracellular protease/amidase
MMELKHRGMIFRTVIALVMFSCKASAQQDTVLMFVSYEQTYFSEYVVLMRALQANGYTVDVRSVRADSAGVYMVPSTTDIEETANTLPGSSYAQFVSQFQNLFNGTWNSAWNSMPGYIPVNGRIQDVLSTGRYKALVIAGGTGSIDYRVDGSYASQGAGGRTLSASEVQSTAEALNSLALEFLSVGKPVLAQCHASGLPVYWRIPSTSGPGEEVLGYSLLKGQSAAGFPEAATSTSLTSMDVTYRENDRVTVSSPHSSFSHGGKASYKIITTRDWYPQTVAHAARTLLNILDSYPTQQEMETSVSVLLFHGGAVNTSDCSYLNRANDIPCNYGGGVNIPADYTDLQGVLTSDSPNDPFTFSVTELNITGGSLPYNSSDQTSILSYISQFDVVIFYKHWSTGMTAALQNALVTFADNGGGVIALHHGVYNDIDGSLNKDILVQQLFGVESAMNTWSGNLTNYNLFSTDYGHFVSTYGISYPAPMESPAPWNTNALPLPSNVSFSYHQRFPVYDELYNNLAFVSGQTFGRGINQITPIFSNDQDPSSQSHTSGFVKHFDPSLNGTVGKVAFFEVGERKENISIDHRYGQVIRNAAAWMASTSTALPVEFGPLSVREVKQGAMLLWKTMSEVNNYGFEIERRMVPGSTSHVPEVHSLNTRWEQIGFVEGYGNSNTMHEYSFVDRSVPAGTIAYRLKQIDRDGTSSYSPSVEFSPTSQLLRFELSQNYPNPFNPSTSIRYTIPNGAGGQRTELKVFDIIGREMAILVNEIQNEGIYHVRFDASTLAAGMYLYRLRSGSFEVTRTMMLMK